MGAVVKKSDGVNIIKSRAGPVLMLESGVLLFLQGWQDWQDFQDSQERGHCKTPSNRAIPGLWGF